jgi:hypothetical protein
LAAKSAQAAPLGKTATGAEANILAHDLAVLAAEDFNLLTRRAPTTMDNKGFYPDFLREIFDALGVEAGVHPCVRHGVNAWKKAQSGRYSE